MNEVLLSHKREQISNRGKLWMNFKNIRLNEKNWTEKMMYYIIYFILQSGKGKTK